MLVRSFCSRVLRALGLALLVATAAAPALAAPASAPTPTPAAPASECEQVVAHVTAVMKRIHHRMSPAARDKIKAQLAAQPEPKKACAGKPALKPGLAACLLGATRLRGLKKCQKQFGGGR